MMFSVVYKVAKGFIDKKTQKKIKVISSKKTSTKKLLEFIDEDKLPIFLGGKYPLE